MILMSRFEGMGKPQSEPGLAWQISLKARQTCYAFQQGSTMKHNHQLWRTLHVLIHMSHQDAPMTSEAIGIMLNTNPVVVRRTMAGLREKGYLKSEKGHGGGWKLNSALDEINLLDVYQALGSPPVFALGPAAEPSGCLVEKAVNQAVADVFEQARALLLARFASITLADLEKDFQTLLKDRGLEADYFAHLQGKLAVSS